MKIHPLHDWNVPAAEARTLQKELAGKVELRNGFGEIRRIAGADLSISPNGDEGIGGILVFSFPDLEVIERKWARRKLNYPYIPGLLSFREAPVLLAALEKVETEPDILIFDGQGIAHPRRLGLAAHLGLVLNKPSIGCAKSLLCGDYGRLGSAAGSVAPLLDHGERLGTVLRTRKDVNPVFVSPGHKIDFESSTRIVRQCCDGLRIPKPTRLADRYVAELKAGSFLKS